MPSSAASLALDGTPTRAARALHRRAPRLEFSLGKYREILIAVAFFLLFDLAVLVLNFYVSYQISEDAISINLSGRQRMLTQRLSKSLYAAELSAQSGQAPAQAVVDEVLLASRLFDESLSALRRGGTVTGGDGKPVRLEAAQGLQSADLLQRSLALWEPWNALLQPLHRAGAAAQAASILAAADYARRHNLALLGLMNELTSDLEAAASQRASLLRKVQTGGIVLALLNFLFILFKFIRRLRRSDLAIEQAQDETREILSVVREGLFLLTPKLTLGTQLSHSVSHMLGRPVQAGEPFLALLAPLVSRKVLDDARGYVELLFSPHIQEDLVQSINPLTDVALSFTDGLGQTHQRHLSLRFNRVMEGGEVRHLLVTMQDVSERIALQERLQGEQQRGQREFELLMQAAETSPLALAGFIHRSESALLEVNDLLRQVEGHSDSKALRRIVDAVYRHIHAVKGEAAMLSLDLLAATAHSFESQLQSLRESGQFSGEALLALPLPLEELLNRLRALKRLVPRHRFPGVGSPAASTSSEASSSPQTPARAAHASAHTEWPRQWQDLAQRVAKEVQRPVELHSRVTALPAAVPEATRDAVQRIAVQLVRNAVAHGIEDAAARRAANKPPVGRIEVSLGTNESESELELTVRDDGQGLDMGAIRARLLALRWVTPEQLAEMSPSQVIASIFKPGFSTARELSAHAGRGVGLDVVAEEVRRLGGRVLVTSSPGQGLSMHVRCAI